ncbi:heavy metal-associated isoprenylated plant protein 39-like [Nymphaea colorata]|uniref:heavy metal-associated isoprenylated plant protein 39-like n=1 Tax=Nymphaea colorata TaxID=210225 RepID=UPI00129D84A9|nr:heavy metal-associated isoprenylated plant protein 39-like [Nymphaea colorata]
MKEVVLSVEWHGEKAKQKASESIASLSGVHHICVDPNGKKLTVVGDMDPTLLVTKLRKLCKTDIVTVGDYREEKEDAAKDVEPIQDKRARRGHKTEDKKPEPEKKGGENMVAALANNNPPKK